MKSEWIVEEYTTNAKYASGAVDGEGKIHNLRIWDTWKEAKEDANGQVAAGLGLTPFYEIVMEWKGNVLDSENKW